MLEEVVRQPLNQLPLLTRKYEGKNFFARTPRLPDPIHPPRRSLYTQFRVLISTISYKAPPLVPEPLAKRTRIKI